MILVDTSVWIDHLDHGVHEMNELLLAEVVVMHPFVLGELAMGNLKVRRQVLADLMDLTSIKTASNEEVLGFVDTFRLHGKGIGYVDAHLLASTRITPRCRFWTRDKRLRLAAVDLDIAYPAV